LPTPNLHEIIQEEYEAPKNNIEKVICKIYSEIFKLDENKIGRMCDFFDIGGNSLNAIRIISKIYRIYGIKITIKEIMENSNVKKLANIIAESLLDENRYHKDEVIKKYNSVEFPTSIIFSNYTFKSKDIEKFESQSNYNMFKIFEINHEIYIEKLKESFNILMERQKVLKTVFIEKYIDGKRQIYGKIRDHAQLEIERYDCLKNFKPFIRPFDLTKDLLIRVSIINNKYLIIDIDHHIADGYSIKVLMNDLLRIYKNQVLEELPIQYSDYSIYYDEILYKFDFNTQLSYYKSIFNKDITEFKLNDKNVRYTENIINNNKNRICNLHYKTDTETYNIINKFTNENGLSKTAFFLTTYSLIMSIYGNQNNVYSAIVSSNRGNDQTENLIGLFAKYIPILVKIDNNNSNSNNKNVYLNEIVKHTMNDLLTIFNYDIPIARVIEELNLPECKSRFKFDSYDISRSIDQKNKNYFKELTSNEVETLFGKKDNMINPHLENSDFFLIVQEFSNYYEIDFNFNQTKYEEGFIQEILNKYMLLIENEHYLNNTIDFISTKMRNLQKNMNENIFDNKTETNNMINDNTKIGTSKINELINCCKMKDLENENNKINIHGNDRSSSSFI